MKSYINLLLRSKIHISMYACLFRVRVSLILWTATSFSLKIVLVTKVGFDINFISFFSHPLRVLTSTLFRSFSIVLPNTELFVCLKKSFSNEVFT